MDQWVQHFLEEHEGLNKDLKNMCKLGAMAYVCNPRAPFNQQQMQTGDYVNLHGYIVMDAPWQTN